MMILVQIQEKNKESPKQAQGLKALVLFLQRLLPVTEVIYLSTSIPNSLDNS